MGRGVKVEDPRFFELFEGIGFLNNLINLGCGHLDMDVIIGEHNAFYSHKKRWR